MKCIGSLKIHYPYIKLLYKIETAAFLGHLLRVRQNDTSTDIDGDASKVLVLVKF